jgi:hypothetical protein
VSDREPLPESHPLSQLAQLVRHAGEELAAFRKRAMAAEARLREYETSARSGDLFAEQRAAQLEKENAELRARLDFATAETKAILAQVRFLRQQAERPVTGPVPEVANGAVRGKREEGRGKRGASPRNA